MDIPSSSGALESWIRTEHTGKFPASVHHLALARRILQNSMVNRAIDRGYALPMDLSGACKFGSLFAKALFGGRIQGNCQHQFNLIDGEIIDLGRDSADVKDLLKDGRDAAYGHDEEFFCNPEHLDSMWSCIPRVKECLLEFECQLNGTMAPLVPAELHAEIHEHVFDAFDDDSPQKLLHALGTASGASTIAGSTLLTLAVRQDATACVQTLLARGASILGEVTDDGISVALHEAVSSEKAAVMLKVILDATDPALIDFDGRWIAEAAERDNKEAVRTLLIFGCPVSSATVSEMLDQSEGCNWKMLEEVIDAGAIPLGYDFNLAIREEQYENAALIAIELNARGGSYLRTQDIIESLELTWLDRDAVVDLRRDIDEQLEERWTRWNEAIRCFEESIQSTSHQHLRDFIADRGNDVLAMEALYRYSIGPSSKKSSGGEVDYLHRLLDAGYPVDTALRCGSSLLSAAIQQKRSAIVGALLGRGARADLPNRIGCSPLGYAAALGDAELLRQLLSTGDAARSRHLLERSQFYVPAESIELLTQQFGVSPEIRNSFGETPLLYSCRRQRVACVEMLGKLGADATIKDRLGQSPLHLAANWDFGHLEDLLHTGWAPEPRFDGKMPSDLASGKNAQLLSAYQRQQNIRSALSGRTDPAGSLKPDVF